MTVNQRLLMVLAALLFWLPASVPQQVGPRPEGSHFVATGQLLRPAGESLQFGGRPVDIALSPDKRTLYVKDNRGIVVVDVETWKVRQELLVGRGGSSMHGIAVSPDGSRVYFTDAGSLLREAVVQPDGSLQWGKSIEMPRPDIGGESYPCGIALSTDGNTAYVALSRSNSLAAVDLREGKVVAQIPVGVAPFAVKVSADGGRAYVSNWGGRHPRSGEKTATTSGTPAVVDARGVAASGTVSVIDLQAKTVIAEIEVGLQSSGIALDEAHSRLYVANANSDTVSVIDTSTLRVVETISVRPDASLPFGSMPNALALTPDGNTLFVANGGNNAVAVVRIDRRRNRSRVEGFIPAGWYPGAVVTDGKRLFVANIKGVGSRNPQPEQKGWNVYRFLGTVQRVAMPNRQHLALGRIVEAISKSKFWAKTCIFVIEDDPQDGFDHVDGHRSLCLVISPYTKRGAVVSEFYNQSSVLHTICRILGVPPMNQMVALSPVMTACFTDQPDLTPYQALPSRVPLDELNPPLQSLSPQARHWAEASLRLPLEKPDLAEEDLLNRILWHAVRGVDAPYPVEFAGAHDKGLAARGVVLGSVERSEED
jgi:YVTN family beta-propeller protein